MKRWAKRPGDRWTIISLIVLAVVAFAVINGGFLYGVIMRPDSIREAMTNPVSLAFMVEALLLVPLFAYLFERWSVSRLGWPWFVLLSLLGSIAFAVPVMLLFPHESTLRATRSPESAPSLATCRADP